MKITDPACPEHRAWADMVERHGSRVSKAWRADVVRFFVDVGPQPSPAHALTLIDEAGEWKLGNVRWTEATKPAIAKAAAQSFAMRWFERGKAWLRKAKSRPAEPEGEG